MVEFAVSDEDEVLGLAHEVVAVDQDLLVEESHVLHEDALHVAVVVDLLNDRDLVVARTVAVDESCFGVDYDDFAGLRVEVAAQDLEWDREVVEDFE